MSCKGLNGNKIEVALFGDQNWGLECGRRGFKSPTQTTE